MGNMGVCCTLVPLKCDVVVFPNIQILEQLFPLHWIPNKPSMRCLLTGVIEAMNVCKGVRRATVTTVLTNRRGILRDSKCGVG